ncbi:MAG: 1-deoxy-D-xylulose-5-phosphate synthase [Sedimentisphaerales bacterium]|nr:1-deoxy-D-xylulose-5-phosphate synthase [Sedimentisphaerales bacterium]
MGELLEQIRSPADLRRLAIEQLGQLAEEIRQLIMRTVSHTGGHLASNLGIVELTIALHYVFNFARDRLTWDVGHQCYVHKILTGRAGRFPFLRQEGGLSGFPSPAESDYDQFYVGHAGTAVATALGLALAAQKRRTSEKIVAVVGDASIVNGLSFEGLNNTSLVNRQMLIILNDNSMAIDATQGAFANYLSRLRLSRSYEDLHRHTKILVRRLPYIGNTLHDGLHRIKGGIKSTLLSRQIFEQLGIPYFGPIDGHDVSALIQLLGEFKQVNHPVVLHIQTEKGRGFDPARKDPCTFHSPQPFKINGTEASFPSGGEDSYTAAFARGLIERMAADERIVALTAAMPDGTGLARVRQRFGDRVLDVGIAESAAVDIAAGIAKAGLRPVVAIYSTFLQRCFDMIFQEVALQNLPVVFAVDRAGLVGGDGAVHHGFCDIALLRSLPNLVLMAPWDEAEMHAALRFALDGNRPCVIRYPRDLLPEIHLPADPDGSATAGAEEDFCLGRARRLRPGTHAAILAYGSTAAAGLQAADILHAEGCELAVYNARFAKPLDAELIETLLAGDDALPVVTVEDHALMGGFGSAVLEQAQRLGLETRHLTRLGIPDRFIAHKSRGRQLAEAGIDAESIARHVRQILEIPARATH